MNAARTGSGLNPSLEPDTEAPRGFILADAGPDAYGLEVGRVVRGLNAVGSDRGFDAYSVIAGEASVLGNATRDVLGTVSSWKVYSCQPFEGMVCPELLGERRLVFDYPSMYMAISGIETPAGLPRSPRLILQRREAQMAAEGLQFPI